ncbi:DUF6476 family protein [Roseovarius sp. THAF8]|uniref:DUF6476 family protein n=1 Tax=Roseovarius sp. THAF8 TaxID=2587846 RepID=UPI001268F501|nr:DUF6476 family protein [Roseovarius sp. THAF8]
MNDTPQPPSVDPKMVRYLRTLVTVLTGVMILGFLVIVALFVTKFSGASGPALPEEITLPDGTTPTAFTRADGWYAIVTDADTILIFDETTGELRQTIDVTTD